MYKRACLPPVMPTAVTELQCVLLCRARGHGVLGWGRGGPGGAPLLSALAATQMPSPRSRLHVGRVCWQPVSLLQHRALEVVVSGWMVRHH